MMQAALNLKDWLSNVNDKCYATLEIVNAKRKSRNGIEDL